MGGRVRREFSNSSAMCLTGQTAISCMGLHPECLSPLGGLRFVPLTAEAQDLSSFPSWSVPSRGSIHINYVTGSHLTFPCEQTPIANSPLGYSSFSAAYRHGALDLSYQIWYLGDWSCYIELAPVSVRTAALLDQQ